jgi:hypothetical protein
LVGPSYAATFARFAIFAIVALPQPVTAWIAFQLVPWWSMLAMYSSGGMLERARRRLPEHALDDRGADAEP